MDHIDTDGHDPSDGLHPDLAELADDADDDGYSQKVGERLRAIRRQKRLSLQEVETSSRQEFKASVVGAYERGERAISVPRLQRLAAFYEVPIDQLLPRTHDDLGGGGVVDITDRAVNESRPLTIDLVALRELDIPGADLLARYLQMIQVQRQDFNGRMLTVRRDDLRAIACLLDLDPSSALAHLSSLGLVLSA
jgi:transcriptional regulator with XRE-family HTH domain